MALTLDGTNGVSAVQAGAVESGDLPSEAYQKNNILGTVSESSGTPTGAIIERGSNANGEYVKFADGTMIAHWFRTIFGNREYNLTFPVAFLAGGNSGYSVVANFTSGTSGDTGTVQITLKNSGSFRVNVTNRNNSNERGVNYIAIGRWY